MKCIRIVILIIALIVIIPILVSVGIYYYNINTEISTNLDEIKPIEPVEIVEDAAPVEEQEEKTSFSLVMVGDYLIHDSIYKDAAKNAGYIGYDFRPMLTLIKDRVQNFDLAYYNQETILGGAELGVSTYPDFNSPYEAGDAMIDAGFNLVSLATNHTMDKGIQAVLNSRNYWDSQENVVAVGSYDSQERRDTPLIQEKNGITYSVLNYTYGTNGIRVPQDQKYLVNVWPTSSHTMYEEYKEKVRQDVEAVRNNVDVLMVTMHWGEEYSHTPTEYQEDAARYLADLGVDIIIGTHPHVIQPVTWIDDTLVFYSLGNFISAQKQNSNYNKMVGLMSSLEIIKTTKGDEKILEVANLTNELIYTYYNQSTWRDFKVVPFSDSNIEMYLPDYQNIYERYKQIVKQYDENMKVEEMFVHLKSI